MQQHGECEFMEPENRNAIKKPLFHDEEHHWYSDDLQSAYETSHQQTVNRKVKCRNYHRSIM